MIEEKLQMLKHTMQLVVSSLGPRDWLSIMTFLTVASAKRLLLQQMSRQG
ncbi:hypothetical protein MUK42_27570 [Musa troglodytarum]|uniref:Uncharacterized protein n=1 Tax=Musa troglodytarum TaxID=320322 RepID=A0A9E7F291_9LILI|nr:hypothetical protein MUK42_27570 [Musa troglodytarum]